MLLPIVSELSEPQYRLLLFFQALVVKHAESALPPIVDTDIADAAAAVAATFETAGKGIIYEHQAASMPAQRLAAELGHALAEMRRNGAPPSIEREATAALRRLERGARTAAALLPDDQPPVFLGVLRRVMTSTEPTDSAAASAPGPSSSLIIPG